MCWRRVVLGLGCLLAIACDEPIGLQVAGPGSLRITVSTTGLEPDSDGYFVIVDGLNVATISASAQWTDPSVQVGEHSVLLGGTAANCTVTSLNPVAIKVRAQTLTTVTFAVQCVSTHGSLHITTATSGVDLDPNGYYVCLDPTAGSYGTSCTYRQPIAVNGAVTVTVGAGDHHVLLEDIAGNCAVSGDNPRVVTTSVGNTIEVALSLTCTTLPRLHVTTATTGAPVAPNGYSVCVDPAYDYYDDLYCYSGAPQPIGLSGALTFGVSVGNHTVLLNGVPDNCVIGGTNPRPASATGTDTTQVPFNITCAPPGSVHVSISTVGVDIDPDGYTVCIDQPAGDTCHWSRNFAVNEAFTFAGVSAGAHTVVLNGAAGNCAISGGNSRAVTVPSAGSVDVTFSLTCALVERIAFSQNGQIDVVHADGSALAIVTAGHAPAWAPDGTRLAYECSAGNVDICVVNPDGSGKVQLTTESPAAAAHPAWSPDGLKIAFASTRSGAPELYVMHADGSSVVRLTNGVGFVGSPAWSPDGNTIVFDCRVDAGNDDICAVHADGTGFVRLTTDAGHDYGAAWKPDGSRLAFVTTRFGTDEIALMNSDGTGVTRIGSGLAGSEPAWSVDGSQFAFVRSVEDCGYYDCYTYPVIFVARADGGNVNQVTYGNEAHSPAWKPHP
ncbi:MAG: hypothetical protein DMD38_05110 [Gemmatimonadetes bacterium]|nr:MAG: hypothetical protein AUG85_01630 [Gemmatimonadetes bacterium 13_1_20CM_4_66_11]PYP97845.1 MAG: hypothetical protein DMD38_05110 [Gemmatimonadota bacterium]